MYNNIEAVLFFTNLCFLYFLFQERDDWVQAIEQQILLCLQSNESDREKVIHVMVGLWSRCPKVILTKVLSPKMFS